MSDTEIREAIIIGIMEHLQPQFPELEIRLGGYRDELRLFDAAGAYMMRIKTAPTRIIVTHIFGNYDDRSFGYEDPASLSKLAGETMIAIGTMGQIANEGT